MVLLWEGRNASLGHSAHSISQDGALVSIQGGVHCQKKRHVDEGNSKGGGASKHTQQDL